ncbi:MAG: EamA family transporter [Vulcanimicrobiota bacterium]
MSIAKNPYFLLVTAVLLGVGGQFLFKTGLNRMGGNIELNLQIYKVFLNPFVVSGLGCYVCSTVFWLSALSRVPLSYAYPMLSIGYILIFIISVIYLDETYSHTKLLANILIIMGIILLNIKK